MEERHSGSLKRSGENKTIREDSNYRRGRTKCQSYERQGTLKGAEEEKKETMG